ncbi:MAG TPA: rhodanese-like domain-containing protein [Candidatus Binatia bacterium]|nr:rhodanese-like domain-containing protein [Candidatus Binatia bacterium]
MAVKRSCQELADLMNSDDLFAVFDIRERGEYNQCQIPGTTSLPRSQIEFRGSRLVPNPDISVIIYDQAEERAPLAAETLTELGYRNVSILRGGITAWSGENRPTVSGVNVPSKAFGEKVHHERSIPEISADELFRLQKEHEPLRILDVRTPEEYGGFCIPGAVNVPGGDLILWLDELRESTTPVIVNCAGRTRSIIGTAALRRLGLTNVRALKNGTMGWVLSGLDLEKNPPRRTTQASEQSRTRAVSQALALAAEENIAWISPDEIAAAVANQTDTVTYAIDVRSEAEYEFGHIAGSINVPGGQAVQRADDFVAVRNGQIIFISNDSVRAIMAAYWYRQMGYPHVFVLRGGLRAWSGSGGQLETGMPQDEPLGFETAKRNAHLLGPEELARRPRKSTMLILDVGTSVDFEAAHVPGANWISRGWLEIVIPERFRDRRQAIVLTCSNGAQSIFAARALQRVGYTDVAALSGGVRAWSAAGFPTEAGLDRRLMEPNDVVLSPSVRGSREDMQRYLDWEVRLTKPA